MNAVLRQALLVGLHYDVTLRFMRQLSFILFILLYSCRSSDKVSDISFPEGGYDLPKKVESKDSSFFCYPIKSIESANDSFHDAFYGHLFLDAFNEPNISTKSFGEPIFRLIYECWTCPAYIITLTPNEITVKKGDRVDYAKRDDSLLTELEKFHLRTMEWNFPIIKGNDKIKPSVRHYLDSLIDLYPNLTNPDYLNQLLSKVFVPCKTPFSYTTAEIPISSKQYTNVVKLINESGYWKMPIRIECNDAPNDAAGFILEANTGSKYNVTKFSTCSDKPTKFIDACKALAELARVKNKLSW